MLCCAPLCPVAGWILGYNLFQKRLLAKVASPLLVRHPSCFFRWEHTMIRKQISVFISVFISIFLPALCGVFLSCLLLLSFSRLSHPDGAHLLQSGAVDPPLEARVTLTPAFDTATSHHLIPVQSPSSAPSVSSPSVSLSHKEPIASDMSDQALLGSMQQEIVRIEQMLDEMPSAAQIAVGAAAIRTQLADLKPAVANFKAALADEDQHDHARAGAETDYALLRAIRLRITPFANSRAKSPTAGVSLLNVSLQFLAKQQRWIVLALGILGLIGVGQFVRGKMGQPDRKSVKRPKRPSAPKGVVGALPLVQFSLIPGLSRQTFGHDSVAGSGNQPILMNFEVGLQMHMDFAGMPEIDENVSLLDDSAPVSSGELSA